MRRHWVAASGALSACLCIELALSASLILSPSSYAAQDEEGFAQVEDVDGLAFILMDEVSEIAASHASEVNELAEAAIAEYEAEQARLEWERSQQYWQPTYWAPQDADAGSLRYDGVQTDGEYTYTWYSQRVLPGGGLDIPGRHVGDGGYVMDGDGNIVVASSDLEQGTVVETPYGTAKVYDSGCDSGVLDVYTDW